MHAVDLNLKLHLIRIIIHTWCILIPTQKRSLHFTVDSSRCNQILMYACCHVPVINIANHRGCAAAGQYCIGGGPGAVDAQCRRRRPSLPFPQRWVRSPAWRDYDDSAAIFLYAATVYATHHWWAAAADRCRQQHRRPRPAQRYAGNCIPYALPFPFNYLRLVYVTPVNIAWIDSSGVNQNEIYVGNESIRICVIAFVWFVFSS